MLIIFLFLQRKFENLKIMINKLSLSDFDFSGKRVRYHGEVQTKFQLSYLIGWIDPFSAYHIYCDFPYSAYVDYLKSHLI